MLGCMMGQVITDQKLVMYAFFSSVPCSSAVNYIFNLISEHIAHAILLAGENRKPQSFSGLLFTACSCMRVQVETTGWRR